MSGKYINGKIVYTTPTYNFLSGGSWKTGWSGVRRSGGDQIEYEISNPNNIQLVEGKWYKFELNDNLAIIK